MWPWRKKAKAVDEAERALAAATEAAKPTVGVTRSTNILLGLAGATVVAFGLWAMQSIVSPVLLALVLTICVHPLRIGLEKRHVPRGVATTSVVAAVFLLLAAFVAALIYSVAQFAALLPQFAPQLQQMGRDIAEFLTSLGISEDQILAIVQNFDPTRLLALATGLLGSVSSLTFGLVVILTCLILMAADASVFPALFKQLRPARGRLVAGLESYASGVRRYMAVTAGLGLAQGALNALALWILQVPGAPLWGLLTFICSFIPNIGYFIAIIPPLFFGYLVGGVPTLIWVVVIYGIVNGVVQSIIQPRVVGNAVALSQTITFVSVLFWALIVGPVGAILAIPLTLLVRTVLIDSDPASRWWRPVIGDLAETKELQRADDQIAKQVQKARKAGKAPVVTDRKDRTS